MRPLLFLFAALASPLTQAGYDASVPENYVSNLLKSSPQAYFAAMNTGWNKKQYASLKGKLSPGRSYLVLHNRLPSTPLDLRDPNGFRKSVFDLGLLKMSTLDIGHVMLGWHCEIDGRVYEGNTGITGEQGDQQKAMAKSGWGLTGLFSIFKDGHLQTPLLVSSVLNQHLDKQVATIAFEVEPQQCRQMLSYIQAFLSHPRKPFKRFGLNADPLKFEGGGCGSFGAAALSTSGAFDDFFPYLWRDIKANRRIFGYGLPNLPIEIEPYAIPHKPGDSYSINQLKAMFVMDWNASSASSAIPIRLMDPELLFLVQHTLMRQSLDDVYRDSLANGRALMKSPFIRARVLKGPAGYSSSYGGPPPENKIDAKFDPKAAAVVEGSKRWFRGMKNKGYRAKGFEFHGYPAVLLTR